MDFGFVKYARVNAGAYSYPYYKYRSVMMVENRYIAIYDAVGDAKQHCRFTWSQSSGGEFPVIKNLRPGVEAFVTGEGVPVDSGAGYNSKYPPRKIMNFNGQGDFLTVVTHLRNYHDERLIYSIDKKDYGAELIFPQTREEVFNDQARIYVDEKEFSFDGYVGYLTDTHLQKRLAIFNGSYIRLDDFSLTIPFDREIRYGMSAVLSENEVRGSAREGVCT